MNKIPDFHKSRCTKCKNVKTKNEFDWDFVDHIYCISLKDREDRTRKAEKEFHKVGLCDKVIFYRPEKDTSDFKRPGTRGCWTSHRTVAKKAVREGADKVLIFEDDVEFDNKTSTPKNIRVLGEIAKFKKNWNIIYLGHWTFFSLPTRFLNLHRDFSMAAHAYLITGKALDWLVRTKYEDGMWLHKNKNFIGFGIDVFYMFFPKAFSFFPMLAYQRGVKSSNQRPHKFGAYLIDWGLSDPRFMKYNQYLVFCLSVCLVGYAFIKLYGFF